MNRPYNLEDVLADIDEHMAEEQFLNERLNDLIQWFEEQNCALVQAVKDHAGRNYNFGGWDFVVDCWSDEDIAKEVAACTTAQQAINRVGHIVGIIDELRHGVWQPATWKALLDTF